MIVWAVANQKGGVGKTTTAVSLGGVLAKKEKRVLLVDLDPHGSLTEHFGIAPERVKHSVFDLFMENITDIRPAIVPTRFSSLFVVPATLALATVEKQIGNREGMGLVLQRALKRLNGVFDFAILDCAPMVGVTMINAIAACDRFIIPAQTEHLALHGLDRMMRTLAMVEKSRGAAVPHVILPTLFDRRTRAGIRTLEVMRDRYGSAVSDTVIPVDTQLRDASREATPLPIFNASARASLSYTEFAEGLLRAQDEHTTAAVA